MPVQHPNGTPNCRQEQSCQQGLHEGAQQGIVHPFFPVFSSFFLLLFWQPDDRDSDHLGPRWKNSARKVSTINRLGPIWSRILKGLLLRQSCSATHPILRLFLILFIQKKYWGTYFCRKIQLKRESAWFIEWSGIIHGARIREWYWPLIVFVGIGSTLYPSVIEQSHDSYVSLLISFLRFVCIMRGGRGGVWSQFLRLFLFYGNSYFFLLSFFIKICLYIAQCRLIVMKIYFVMALSQIFYLLISLSVSVAANYLKLLHFRRSYSVYRDNGAHCNSHAPSFLAHRWTLGVFPDSVTWVTLWGLGTK